MDAKAARRDHSRNWVSHPWSSRSSPGTGEWPRRTRLERFESYLGRRQKYNRLKPGSIKSRLRASSETRGSSLDPSEEFTLLGKLILFDQNLSVNKNEACAFCHMPETDLSGPVSALNMTTVSYPGSIRTRFSSRRPQTHTYVLHYNANQGDFVGGAFWDMRAAGSRTACALNPVRRPLQIRTPFISPRSTAVCPIELSIKSRKRLRRTKPPAK
jgi:cytochrome c peroxidase